MSEGRFERVEQWESEPLTGLEGLHELAAAGFSGAATAGGTWAFLLDGNLVGAFGDLEAFRGASGTAYTAPHDSLPLLTTMLERGGETRATYYTKDTPLSEVEATLADAGFTGYVELSENVLSGDYYTVYHGGNSLHAAFVGASDELETGEEAATLARDEVGLYEVVRVPVEVHDLPEPENDAGAAAVGESDPEGDSGATPESESESDSDPGAVADAGPDPEPEPSTAERGVPAGTETDDATDRRDDTAAPQSTGAAASGGPTTRTEVSEGGAETRFDDEAEWRETVSIPAVTPEESGGGSVGAAARSTGSSTEAPADSGDSPPRSDRREELEARTEALEEARERLAVVAEERDELAAERDDLEAERDRLSDRVEDLREEVADLREQVATAPDSASEGAGRTLSPEEALAGTDLFVRYGSRGEATLEGVADGASAADVRSNLHLDHHTQFDTGDLRVAGESYEAFLRATPEYGFVEWLVETLPFEIRDTDHEGGLRDLYAALPAIDRADMGGTVRVETSEGTAERTFDVVVRDRMGEALVVADINDERAPVTGELMSGLVDDATAVATDGDLAAAFYVTASFFEPAALETADDATGGGLLSRSSKESFVRTARKRGFHLCLVERRNGAFYLNVPEL